jgi:hypothetical protein
MRTIPTSRRLEAIKDARHAARKTSADGVTPTKARKRTAAKKK